MNTFLRKMLVIILLALSVAAQAACASGTAGGTSGGNGNAGGNGGGKAHHLGGIQNKNAPKAPVTGGILPATVDQTQYDPPVGYQGNANSCVAWATGYYLRGWYAKRDGYYPLGGSPPNGSFEPMYTYAQIVHGSNGGTSFPANLDIQQQQGIDTRADYVQGDYDYTTQPTTGEAANAGQTSIMSYNDFSNPGGAGFQNWIESSLAAGNPVAIMIPDYPEFDNVSASTNWVIGTPTHSESSRGNHAVFAPKYDVQGLWIENSWGTGWGNNGFGELSWAFVNQYGLEAVNIVPRLDFAGTWDGMESANPIHRSPTLIRMVITQHVDQVAVSIYSQKGGVIPRTPQDVGTATISGGTLSFSTTEILGGQPFTDNQWVLSFPTPGTLHFTHHTQFVAPGDTRGSTDTSGDLRCSFLYLFCIFR